MVEFANMAVTTPANVNRRMNIPYLLEDIRTRIIVHLSTKFLLKDEILKL